MSRFSEAAAGALIIVAALAPQALGQNPAPTQQVLHDPDAIRACLCRHQAVTSLQTAMDNAKRTYDARQQELQALDRQIAEARQHLDVASLAERDSYARLLDQRDAASDRLAADTVPGYNALVSRYQAQAAAFNSDCAGKAYDPQLLPQIQSTLSCPPVALGTDPRTGAQSAPRA
ncbi:MAG TPA: hypothetical protein VFA22_02610 [Stellaceae bacterium]|nr:hypothetical protein [Stellaceae bacterium]